MIADETILDDAADWHERMQNAPDAGTRQGFEAWLAASDAHAAAYDRVSAGQRDAAALADETALLALRHEAIKRAMLAPPRHRLRKSTIAAGLLLFAAAPLAALGYEQWFARPAPAPFEQTFRTAIGQQTDVALPDGSTVRLDTNSQLHVAFTAKERRVVLDGQGWFEVKDASRPFLIKAADRELSATQGRFDVRTDPGQVRAFADSGTLSLAAGSSSIALGDGKLLTVRGEEASIRRLEQPTSFTGWRNGMLLFEDVPLAAAVGELNRYRRQAIGIADAQAGALRIIGSFRTVETPAFVDALKAGFPVRVRQGQDTGPTIASR
ncbi:MAG TPA: FecR domain-containing protein [Sphingomonas sp.]|uniref:FecR family protein n=1 Tax=Sphingomonas sp. TaxID=28214 RepID=UPI002BCD7526|nr:FecR domain-containing protein [Sphingomonas sp.]HMI19664.1 FecR domain-containing protein [Sphingomonas sp.]